MSWFDLIWESLRYSVREGRTCKVVVFVIAGQRMRTGEGLVKVRGRLHTIS